MLVRFGVVSLLLAPYASAVAQQISPTDLVKGEVGNYACSMKIADLPEDFKAVEVVSQQGSFMDSLIQLQAFSGAGRDPQISNRLSVSKYYWSNGDIVKVFDRPFLVTYRLNIDPGQIQAMSQSTSPNAEAPMLKLSLISTDSIQSVTPQPAFSKTLLEQAFQATDRSVPTAPASAAASPYPGDGQSAQLSNLKQVALATIMYENDYDDVYPAAQGTKAVQFVTYPYLKNGAVWKSLNPNGGKIVFNVGLAGVSSTALPEPANTVMFYESKPWPDGRRGVAFADGHCKFLSEEEWRKYSGHLVPNGVKRPAKFLPINYGANFDPEHPRG
ncbi:MAG: hypothetical protein P4L46_12150 [Fimbriimonas sp.]|nr:hypothetical protein [Fimbriimonas sp.]